MLGRQSFLFKMILNPYALLGKSPVSIGDRPYIDLKSGFVKLCYKSLAGYSNFLNFSFLICTLGVMLCLCKVLTRIMPGIPFALTLCLPCLGCFWTHFLLWLVASGLPVGSHTPSCSKSWQFSWHHIAPGFSTFPGLASTPAIMNGSGMVTWSKLGKSEPIPGFLLVLMERWIFST